MKGGSFKDLMNEKMQNIVAKEEELKTKAEGKELPSVMLVIGTADSFMVMNEKSYLVGSYIIQECTGDESAYTLEFHQ